MPPHARAHLRRYGRSVIGVALGPCFLPARIGDDPLEQGAAGYLADVAKRHDVLEAVGDLMDFVAF